MFWAQLRIQELQGGAQVRSLVFITPHPSMNVICLDPACTLHPTRFKVLQHILRAISRVKEQENICMIITTSGKGRPGRHSSHTQSTTRRWEVCPGPARTTCPATSTKVSIMREAPPQKNKCRLVNYSKRPTNRIRRTHFKTVDKFQSKIQVSALRKCAANQLQF